jgi:hypothetical protein
MSVPMSEKLMHRHQNENQSQKDEGVYSVGAFCSLLLQLQLHRLSLSMLPRRPSTTAGRTHVSSTVPSVLNSTVHVALVDAAALTFWCCRRPF